MPSSNGIAHPMDSEANESSHKYDSFAPGVNSKSPTPHDRSSHNNAGSPKTVSPIVAQMSKEKDSLQRQLTELRREMSSLKSHRGVSGIGDKVSLAKGALGNKWQSWTNRNTDLSKGVEIDAFRVKTEHDEQALCDDNVEEGLRSNFEQFTIDSPDNDDDNTQNNEVEPLSRKVEEMEEEIEEDVFVTNFDHPRSFFNVAHERLRWLIGLLIFQSVSSFILANNEDLLQNHLDIVHFLTMLVGAGGNAGNQACVRVIRGLAIGNLNERTLKNYLLTELKMGAYMALMIGITGFIRASLFGVALAETVAITSSLLCIVVISIVLGAVLPLGMFYIGLDPAHSSTSIQVCMDIIGVLLTVKISRSVLETDGGKNFINSLSFFQRSQASD